MSSSDFTFITLRNITAYQPTGLLIPQNYLLNMSTNGTAAWTNNITVETITGSTIVGTNIGASTIEVSTIYGGNMVAVNRIAVSTSFFSTITNYNYTGSASISSILIEIGNNIWKIPVEFVQPIL